MLLGRWESLCLSFLQRHPRLIHHFLHVKISVLWHTFKLLDLRVGSRIHICDSWQLISRVGILDSETGWESLWLLVKVLTEELM